MSITPVRTPWPIRAALAASLPLSRETMVTVAPRSTKARAAASPMPELPPTTSTCLPSKFMMPSSLR